MCAVQISTWPEDPLVQFCECAWVFFFRVFSAFRGSFLGFGAGLA
jgi:hypothetical protein